MRTPRIRGRAAAERKIAANPFARFKDAIPQLSHTEKDLF